MSLMQSYDVKWPSSTHQTLNWADVASLGVSVAAPECRVGAKYNFFYLYDLQMGLPVRRKLHDCSSHNLGVEQPCGARRRPPGFALRSSCQVARTAQWLSNKSSGQACAAQITLVLLCLVIHFLAGQAVEWLADSERTAWLTAERERKIRLWLLDLQTRCARGLQHCEHQA